MFQPEEPGSKFAPLPQFLYPKKVLAWWVIFSNDPGTTEEEFLVVFLNFSSKDNLLHTG